MGVQIMDQVAAEMPRAGQGEHTPRREEQPENQQAQLDMRGQRAPPHQGGHPQRCETGAKRPKIGIDRSLGVIRINANAALPHHC